MGREKGRIVEGIITELRPANVLEIGTFLGYMTITMAEVLPAGSRLVTIEKDPENHAVATKIMSKAFEGKKSPVESWLGASSDVLESPEFRKCHGAFDLVLMDHWKPEYAEDLMRLERLGMVRKGSVVLADNVIFPGAPELLAYLGIPYASTEDEVSGQGCLIATGDPQSPAELHGWNSRLIPVPFEYRPLTPDAISYSVRL